MSFSNDEDTFDDETVRLPRMQHLALLRPMLVESWQQSKRLARAAAAAWRTMRALHVEPSNTPLESLLPMLPLDLSLHLHSFLHSEPSFSAGELHAVCRQWAITLATQTWTAAQEDLAQARLLRSVDDQGRLIQLVACFGSERPSSVSVAVQAMSERLLLQLLHSRPMPGVTPDGRVRLLQWLARIAVTLPGVSPESTSAIFLRTVTIADALAPTVSPALHYMAALLCVANATLHSPGETSMTLTNSQAHALMDGAYSPDEIRAAADAFRTRVIKQMADSSAEQPALTSSSDLLQTSSGAELAAAVFCIVSDVLSRIERPWLSPSLSSSAELPSALWFVPQRSADGTESLRPLQIRDLCCNLEALPNWTASAGASSSAASSASSSASVAPPSALLSACKPLLQHWTPLLDQLWNLQPRPELIAAVLNCCLRSPALLSSSRIPSCANFAALLPLEQTTWREALEPYTRAASASTVAPQSAAAPSSVASAPTVAPQKAPSKARWGLLKRALVKSASDASSTNDDASVRRHAGFKVLHMREVEADELQQLLPPGSENADRSKYLFVRYDLPSDGPATSANAASSVSPTAAASADCSLLFRIRRSGSVSLAELAPDQKIDNTGNVCIWNSEEVLTHVALKLIRRPRSPSSPTEIDLPASLFASPSAAGRPLRILELGAGMSGLCGLALGYSRGLAEAIGEVVITDGNPGCVEGIRFQVAWNAALQQAQAPAAESNATRSTPHISAQVLAWDRAADYSSLGRFDVILVADCLFFRDFHVDLCHVLRSLLQPSTGRAWMIAPTRGGSLDAFVSLIAQQSSPGASGLRVQHRLERYDETIWQQHQAFSREVASAYSADLHFPLLLSIVLDEESAAAMMASASA